MLSILLQKKVYGLLIACLFILLGGVLVACEDDGEVAQATVVRFDQPATDAAATAIALTNAPPTAGPSPTPSPTSTLYQTATPFPDADPTLVVAKVGDREITLAEFQARVRYERWLPLYALSKDLWELGTGLLDLTQPENARRAALFYTLSDPESLGVQTMDAILTDQVVLREAARRDLELEQTVFDGRLAARIGVELGPGGVRPENWDEAYQKFITDMMLYTGMSEEQFLETIKALVYYNQLGEIIGRQAPLPEADVVGELEIQDILVDSREDALEVRERLLEGENIQGIAASFGMTLGENATSRTLTRGDESVTAEIETALFSATDGDVVGPIATDSGWYVALVLGRQLDFAQPADIEALRQEYYQNWIIARLDDPNYSVDYSNWQDFVPFDPLPKDVSPLMRDEFFVLPEFPFAGDQPTPTLLPIGNAPR